MTENKVFLEYEFYREGGEALSNEPYSSREDAHITFNPRCVHLDDKNYKRFIDSVSVDFMPNHGDTVWSVVVRYTTGNTFGTTYGDYVIIGIYDDADKASEVCKAIEDDDRKHEKKYGTLKLPINSPNYSGGEAWKGYFERFEHVEVEGLRVK